MMCSKKNAEIIADLFYLLDKGVRNDLYNQKIADERDYVSRLVTNFNYPFGVFNKFMFEGIQFQSKWFSRVNNGEHERKFGCDSMIVFNSKNKVKVGLFEAKWPRVKLDPNYNWDYTQKKTKESHFSSQIKRQENWAGTAAIWEMFFLEEEVGKSHEPFDKYASTCIRHQTAKIFMQKRGEPIWNNDDLEDLIRLELKMLSSNKNGHVDDNNELHKANIRTVIMDILSDKFGSAIEIKHDTDRFSLTSSEGDAVTLQLLNFIDDGFIEKELQSFMENYGLSFYQQLNMSFSPASDL